MSEPTIGFSVLHPRVLATVAEARAAAIDLATSPSWNAPPRYFLATITPGHERWRRPGMIAAKDLRTFLDAALQNPSVSSFSMNTAREFRPDSRELSFKQEAAYSDFSIAYGQRPQASDGAEAWVQAVLTFIDRVGAGTGVIVAMAMSEEVTSECTQGSISRNGKVLHPFPDQLERMDGIVRRDLGTRYVRFPRWGTLISHDHVAQLGGVSSIVAAVAPAVVRELAGGVYFQLTDSIATARSAEAVARQAAFTERVAALLPPVQAPR